MVTSQALRGRTIVFEFWATWCPACVSSLPALNAFEQLVKDDSGIDVYSVHVPKGAFAPAVEAFMTKRGYDFPVILDRDAQLSRAFQIESIPTLIVVAPDGRVSRVKNGAIGGSAEDGAERIQSWVFEASKSVD
jgi:thiol-disulfide isomerase/thioredoxin